MLTIRPLAAALNKHRHRLSASPCRADGAKGAARHISVTPYPARKTPAPVARLRPSNYPAKRCRVVSGRVRLVITIATKNQVNPSAYTRFAVTASALLSFFIARTRSCLASLGRTGSRVFHEDGSGVAVAGVAPRRRSSPALCTAVIPVFPRPPSRLQSPAGAAFRVRTVGRFTPAPFRPPGAPSTPPAKGTYLCPVPADIASL